MAESIRFVNRRLDASENEALIGMARRGAEAFGYTAELRIDRALAQLLRLRVAQLNNCPYCLDLHHQAAREAGIPRVAIDTLTAWWETELHSDAHRAALRYAETLTLVAGIEGDAFQRAHDALAEHFDAEELLEIVAVVINMNIWTRLKLAEGAMPTTVVDDR
jgi:AhpD family alkylhydroperoxidase